MEPKDQIMEVQHVLDRLTRYFCHLNGWAAVAAGILSIMAYVAICLLFNVPWLVDSLEKNMEVSGNDILHYTVAIGSLLLVAGIICGAIILASLPRDLTIYAWRNLVKLIAVYAAYIICGGALVWAMLNNSEVITLGMLQTIPPMMCLLYGLAQFQAAYISLPSLKYLGFWMLACGILGCAVPSLGWFLWVVAFGPGHILLGIYAIKNGSN